MQQKYSNRQQLIQSARANFPTLVILSKMFTGQSSLFLQVQAFCRNVSSEIRLPGRLLRPRANSEKQNAFESEAC